MLTSVAELAETQHQEATDTRSGYLDSNGLFYSDNAPLEEALAVSKRFHVKMVGEEQTLSMKRK